VLVTEVNCLFSVSVLLIPCVIQCVVVVYNSLAIDKKCSLGRSFRKGCQTCWWGCSEYVREDSILCVFCNGCYGWWIFDRVAELHADRLWGTVPGWK